MKLICITRILFLQHIVLLFSGPGFALEDSSSERHYIADYNTPIGVAKKISSATPTGTPGVYDICYDIYVKNFRNFPLNNVQVVEHPASVFGNGNISNVSVSLVNNPAGVVLNPQFTGGSGPIVRRELLNASLSNLPLPASGNNYFTIRVCFRASNVIFNQPYNSNTTASGRGDLDAKFTDISTDGDNPDPNNNLIPDDPGENIPTTFIVYNTSSTALPLWTPPAYDDPSAKINYVRVWDARSPEQNANDIIGKSLSDVSQATQYTDGLGRPLQTVVKQGAYATGATARDLVSMHVYDPQGREQWQYLPFGAEQSNGNFKQDPFGDHAFFYNTLLAGQLGETNSGPQNLPWAFGAAFYEPSPLNRIDNTYRAGVNWMGSIGSATESGKHNRRIKYFSNTDIDDVKKWTVTNGAEEGDWATYSVSGAYDAGDLYKLITYDEEDKQAITFKDKSGKVILKKVQLTGNEDTGAGQGYGTGWICTYYLYDLKNQLRCIITPQVTQQLSQNGWNLTAGLLEGCYCYEYDRRGFLIMKKKPGIAKEDAEYTVYDEAGRLVMMQDGRQRQPEVNKWMVVLYDHLNRPVIRGLYTGSSTFKQYMSAAWQSTQVPFTIATQPSSGWTVLSEAGYDDYHALPGASGLDGNLDAAYTTGSYMHTTYHTSPLYAQQPLQSFHTRGLVTWTKTAIYGTGDYTYSVNIYDRENRLIQVKHTNISGAADMVTIQHDWTGKPLRIVEKQEFDQLHTNVIVTDIVYDELGREIQLQKKIQSTDVNNNEMPAAWTVIAQTAYDALGRPKKKEIGRQRDPISGSYTTTPLEYLNYEYDVNSALIGINRKLLELPGTLQEPSAEGIHFALELAYDKEVAKATSVTYTNKRFDGNISGLTWKSRGDKVDRKYDFTYDNAGRLTHSAFKQNNGITNTWADNVVNYSESVSYALNGDPLTLSRNGLVLNSSPVIDQLTYQYNTNSSRPNKVTDGGVATTTANLGDFQDGADINEEYGYNPNGSLTADLNKGISAITYWDAAELPRQITTAKGTITHTYDDAGNKLKTVSVEDPSTENGNRTITITTTYINGFVYESREAVPADPANPDYTHKLLFALHEEGRMRMTTAAGGGWAYDYFITDHLGSTRLVLTDEIKILYYPAATLEGTYGGGPPEANSMINYEKLFYNIDHSKVVDESTVPGWNDPDPESYANGRRYHNHNGSPPSNLSYPENCTPVQTDESNKLYKMQASGAKTGLEFVIKVMAGDKIDIFGKSFNNPKSYTYNSALTVLELLTSLLAAPVNPLASKGISPGQLNSINQGLIPLALLQGNDFPGGAFGPEVSPYASVNYLFLDEQLQYAGGGYSPVGDGVFKDHWQSDPVLQNITVPKNGYLFVYVSNLSNRDVYFDNLQVIHKTGPILEDAHYYPFGLKMAGISSRAYGVLKNPYQYQGAFSEFEEATGWNSFALRNYDPQTGRWTGADPYDQFPSPYTGMGNNPVNGVDPDGGLFSVPPPAAGFNWAGLIGTASRVAFNYSLATISRELNSCPECPRLYELLKHTEAARQLGTLVGVSKWAGNTIHGAYKMSPLGMLTTSADEHKARALSMLNTAKTALDYLSLPNYTRAVVGSTYIAAKYDSYIRLSPYEQGVAFGEVAPNLLLSTMPVMRFGPSGRLGSAAKGVDKVKYIGRLEDLKSIPRSQTLLDDLPNLGSPKANYYQNMSVLRKALRDGYTIKDASWFRPNSQLAPTLLNPNRTVGQTFLGAERNLLNNRGLWP